MLAFLPLHRALFCARRLADAFRDAMREFEYVDAEGKSQRPTLSVGIAVGHHLDPLSDTLELAREAERVAKKKVKGKNALAVVVSKRSGADWTVKGSWGGVAEGIALDARLNDFIQLELAGELPRGLGYELRDVALRLSGPELESPLRDEAVRIARRKRTGGGTTALTDEVSTKLEGYLRNTRLSVAGLANELIVARLFAGAFRQAGIDAEAFATLVEAARTTAPAEKE